MICSVLFIYLFIILSWSTWKPALDVIINDEWFIKTMPVLQLFIFSIWTFQVQMLLSQNEI